MESIPSVHVTSPDAVRALLERQRTRARQCLLVTGQYSVQIRGQWAERVGILDVTSRPKVLADAWVLRDSVAELAAHAIASRRAWSLAVGAWDVMYATPWRWAWGGEPLTLWSRRGWVAKVRGEGRAVIRSLGFEREHRVGGVRAEISGDWATHRVGLRTDGERTIWIARRMEAGPRIDVTHDGLELMADTSWASQLGSRFARALGVAYEANDPGLRR